MSTNTPDWVDLSQFDAPDLSGTDFIVSESDDDFAYPLTAFIPSNGTTVTWAIPSARKAVPVRQVRLWGLPWAEKIPPGYNTLYLRSNGKKADPTQFQAFVWRHTSGKYLDAEGRVSSSKMWMVPILRRDDEGLWHHAIAEIQPTAWDTIKKMSEQMSKLSKQMGRQTPITMDTAPFTVRKNGIRDFSVDFDTEMQISDIQPVGDPIDPLEYVTQRSRATEEWLRGMIGESMEREKQAAEVQRASDTGTVSQLAPWEPDEDFTAVVVKMTKPAVAALIETIDPGALDKLSGVDEMRRHILDNAAEYKEFIQ